METPEARAVLDTPAIKGISKMVLGRPLTIRKLDTLEDQRRRLLDVAVQRAVSREVLAAVLLWLEEQKKPPMDPDDRKAVLESLWRLGSLPPEALELETMKLLSNRALLLAMAHHAHIKTTARSSPKTVLAKVLRFAQRVEENTS
jgi:hypothetical protein